MPSLFTRSAACFCLMLLLSACAGTAPHSEGSSLGALQHEALADLQLRAGRPDLAAAGYETALTLRPGDAALNVKRGRALLGLERPDLALEAFRAALAKAPAPSPTSAPALNGEGESLYRLGRLDEAAQTLGRAGALTADNWRGHCLLGLVSEASGHPREAVAEYLAALSAPGSGVAHAELMNNLGVAQALAGKPEDGVRTLRAALNLGQAPEKLAERLANNLGLVLVRLGRYDEALAAFRLPGDDPRALNNMGYALLQRGDAKTAQALFEKALEVSPTYYATAGENLARAVLASGPMRGPANGKASNWSAGQAAGQAARTVGETPAPPLADQISFPGVHTEAAPVAEAETASEAEAEPVAAAATSAVIAAEVPSPAAGATQSPAAAAISAVGFPGSFSGGYSGIDPDADLIPEQPGWTGPRLVRSGAQPPHA